MRNRMTVHLVRVLLTIFCLQEIQSTIIINRYSSRLRYSKCFAAHTHTAWRAENNDVTSESCNATWTEFQDVFTTIDPHIAHGVRGLEDCKEACFKTIPGCVAIDVHPNITLCVYHLRPASELAENRFLALEPGYKQLILNRTSCSGQRVNKETDQKQLQHPTSTISPNDASKSCNAKWTVVRGVHSAGYHTHLGVHGEEACKKDCIENIPGCVGIEIAQQYHSCNYFIQPLEQLVKLRSPLEGHTQHILTRICHPAEIINTENGQTMQPSIINNSTYDVTPTKSCTAKWMKIPDVFSHLYHRLPNTYGREACQKACLESIPECVAISMLEIDNVPLNKVNCLYLVEPLSQVIQSRIPFKGYVQYVLTRECPSDSPARNNETDEKAQQNLTKSCTDKWTKIHGMCSVTSDSKADAEEKDCKKACFDIPGCVAVDVKETVTDSCYYHLEALEDVVKDRRPISGCSQFVLTRECHDSGNNETQNNTTRPSPQDLTPEKVCTWEEHKDVYSFGAGLYDKVYGIEACKMACMEKIAGCIAVDYHATSICWYHSNHSNFDSKRQRFPGRGFIQYMLRC